MDPDGRHDRHPDHGAAQAARPHDRPGRRDHRHPHRLPGRPPPGPRLRPEVLRPGRRLRHLHRPGRRRDVRLRLHRGRHPGLHGRVVRPHRGHVPPPGGDRPVAPGAVPGPDPGRPGHHRAAGGGRLHHRVRGVRLRRPRPRSTTTARPCRPGCRAPGSRPGPPTTPTRSSATSASSGQHIDVAIVPCGNGVPVAADRAGRWCMRPGGTGAGPPRRAHLGRDEPDAGHRRSPTRTTPTTRSSSCTRRSRS